MLKLHVIASGSKGNASVVENAETGRGVLIDCGVTKKALFNGCEECGFDLRKLNAILITHEHSDHVKGLGVALRGLAKAGVRPDVYVNPASLAASTAIQQALASVHAETLPFQAESGCGGRDGEHGTRAGGVPTFLSLAGIDVFPFATSHDAAASFGFRFEATDASGATDALGFMTDTGTVTGEAHAHLQGCRILAIEGNHDLHMLETGPYPYPLRQRIASDHGHLSNDQGACELEELLHNGLEQVVAMHVSQNNNTYRLPRTAFEEALRREGHGAHVQVGFQQKVVEVE